MKVFISQPMDGRSDEEILKEREEIVKGFEHDLGYKVEVIDSFFKEDPPETVKNQRVWYLGDSIRLMHDADAILFAPDYKFAKGCRVEEQVAKSYGFRCIYYAKDNRGYFMYRNIHRSYNGGD